MKFGVNLESSETASNKSRILPTHATATDIVIAKYYVMLITGCHVLLLCLFNSLCLTFPCVGR